jgi:hypothetical protein
MRIALNDMPPSRPRRNDCLGDLLRRAKNKGIREIQARKEILNLGKERAVRPPLITTKRMSAHFIFNRTSFFSVLFKGEIALSNSVW